MREKVTLNVVSMMAGGCAGDAKPQGGAPKTKSEREHQAVTVAAGLEV